MSLSLDDIKNLSLPMHVVISIVIFSISAWIWIDTRYAHKEEVQKLELKLEERESIIREQQNKMYAYFAAILETKKDNNKKRELSHEIQKIFE